jgi:NAD+ synthase (glutamine-hydrolysing)
MKDGFIKVGAATSDVTLGDISKNILAIEEKIDEAKKKDIKVLCFQELNITGYSLMDMFFQKTTLDSAFKGLLDLADYLKGKDLFTVVSLPLRYKSKIYDAAVACFDGEILGIQLKTFLPNYNEFYDARYFTASFSGNDFMVIRNKKIPIGNKLLFQCTNVPDLTIGIEICEDLWTPIPVSTHHCLNGATLILNPSGSNELVGKDHYRDQLVSSTSSRLITGYVYANAGFGESTQDVCYSGHDIIADNGNILSEVNDFSNHLIYSDIAVSSLSFKRSKMTTFINENDKEYQTIPFAFQEPEDKVPDRVFPRNPFLSGPREKINQDLKKMMEIQTFGLVKRISYLNIKDVVIGVSGGLDSALALLICYQAFNRLKLNIKGIHAISMPCFATTSRTRGNALSLAKELGTDFKEIDISKTVRDHLKDLGHPLDVYDTAYENAQARERTQVLMDYSNYVKGIVIGTGDLSEIALGWSTYNGDQMSMYNVNASIPKTMIKEEVRYIVSLYDNNSKLKNTLEDILATPISPELIPDSCTNKDKIHQVTEDILGPYELHDFFLYHMLRDGYDPSTIYWLACLCFKSKYQPEFIYKCLTTFYHRFFNNQFKRSAMPDSIKVGSVALSPRGDLRMPSDMSFNNFIESLKNNKRNS